MFYIFLKIQIAHFEKIHVNQVGQEKRKLTTANTIIHNKIDLGIPSWGNWCITENWNLAEKRKGFRWRRIMDRSPNPPSAAQPTNFNYNHISFSCLTLYLIAPLSILHSVFIGWKK